MTEGRARRERLPQGPRFYFLWELSLIWAGYQYRPAETDPVPVNILPITKRTGPVGAPSYPTHLSLCVCGYACRCGNRVREVFHFLFGLWASPVSYNLSPSVSSLLECARNGFKEVSIRRAVRRRPSPSTPPPAPGRRSRGPRCSHPLRRPGSRLARSRSRGS